MSSAARFVTQTTLTSFQKSLLPANDRLYWPRKQAIYC